MARKKKKAPEPVFDIKQRLKNVKVDSSKIKVQDNNSYKMK